MSEYNGSSTPNYGDSKRLLEDGMQKKLERSQTPSNSDIAFANDPSNMRSSHRNLSQGSFVSRTSSQIYRRKTSSTFYDVKVNVRDKLDFLYRAEQQNENFDKKMERRNLCKITFFLLVDATVFVVSGVSTGLRFNEWSSDCDRHFVAWGLSTTLFSFLSLFLAVTQLYQLHLFKAYINKVEM